MSARSPRTVWRIALARVHRRALAYLEQPTPERLELLREAARLANDLSR